MVEEYVLTPGGFRPKSQVHHVKPGQVLNVKDGSIRILNENGAVVSDQGKIPIRSTFLKQEPLMPKNVMLHPDKVPTSGGPGWVTWGSWKNNTGDPISSFSTTWTVPPEPATKSNQIIFLFPGIQNSNMIYQPVLQWGISAAGGGNYWAVACWYADGKGGVAYYSNLVQVNPGDILVGVMTCTGQTGSNFSYDCYFQGMATTNLTIQNVEELTYACETLECYNITKCSDYPDTLYTAMQAINIQTGLSTPVNPSITWNPNDPVTDCGQNASIVSNSTTDGEVDLYYKSAIQKKPPNPKICFIATAAMGSELHPHVQFLREYRDSVVLKSSYRQQFEKILDIYYQFSPPIARVMNKDRYLKGIIKYTIVYPIVFSLKFIVRLFGNRLKD